MSSLIFDLGANNGDDVEYYLLKAQRVVAVEANPVLADAIRRRFPGPVAEGRLVIESCALTVEPSAEAVPFYVHTKNHVESRFPPPDPERAHLYQQIHVPSMNVVELMGKYEAPEYIKIDIEHYDHVILRALFEANIFPPYLSVESHSIEVLALLIALGKYAAFKLVEGKTVQQRYRDASIETAHGVRKYSFPVHSAGPFGNDVAGPWMTPDNFFRVLSVTGLGWRDIHASRVDVAHPTYVPRTRVELRSEF